MTEGLFYFYSHNIALWRISRGATTEHLFASSDAPKGSQGFARSIWGKHPPLPVTRSRAHYKRRARAEASGFAEGRVGDISKEYSRKGHIDLTVLHPCGII